MRHRFAAYAWTVLSFNVVVILWGALVRASKSGDGCGNNWPLCNGSVLPEAPRIATVIEFTHRLSTGLALIAVVAMAVWAFRAFGPGAVRRAAAASVFFILSEALLGAGLVLLRYVGENASAGRAMYLSAHLVNTLLMLGAIALTAWWGSLPGHGAGPGHLPIRWTGEGPAPQLLVIAIATALLVGVSGAIAALGDTLFPVSSLRAGWEADFSSASHIFIRLRIWHPLIATLGGIYTAIVAVWIARRAPQSRSLAFAVVTMVGLQLTAGVVNLTAAGADLDADDPSAVRRPVVDRAGAVLGIGIRTTAGRGTEGTSNLYFFADSINLTNCSVTCGSSPSVCPFPMRTTSATTRPSLHCGYTKTSAVPGRGKRPQASDPGSWRVESYTYPGFVSTTSGRRTRAAQPYLVAQVDASGMG